LDGNWCITANWHAADGYPAGFLSLDRKAHDHLSQFECLGLTAGR
jgi:hypothetical protein